MPTMPEVTLPQGTVHDRDTGPRDARACSSSTACSSTDAVGRRGRRASHRWPLRGAGPPARLAPHADAPRRGPVARGVAGRARRVLRALGLDRVTVVANDTGGAICQIAATEHPALRRLVLTPCDAFDNFLPPMFRVYQWLARVPIALSRVLQTQRVRAVRRTPMAYGGARQASAPRRAARPLARPALGHRGVRRDTAKLLRGIDARDTLAAAERLTDFDRPALLAWAPEQRTFPFAHAQRLAAILPDARIVPIDDAWAFVPLDQPGRRRAVADFVRDRRAGLDAAPAAGRRPPPATSPRPGADEHVGRTDRRRKARARCARTGARRCAGAGRRASSAARGRADLQVGGVRRAASAPSTPVGDPARRRGRGGRAARRRSARTAASVAPLSAALDRGDQRPISRATARGVGGTGGLALLVGRASRRGSRRQRRPQHPPRERLQHLVAPALGLQRRARARRGSAGSSGGSGTQLVEARARSRASPTSLLAVVEARCRARSGAPKRSALDRRVRAAAASSTALVGDRP